MSTASVLFARTGWMTYYCGPQSGDEKPQRGGKYNYTDIGNEAFNFKNINGRLYGYFQPQMQAGTIQLDRIDPSCSGDTLKGVTVIFVATHPSGGQRITGWYRNATVHRDRQDDPTGERMGFEYFVTTKASDAVLLPTRNRVHEIPGRKGGIGQANIRYVFEGGKKLSLEWTDKAVEFINSYRGDNLIDHAELEAADQVHAVVESQLSKAAGFQSNKQIQNAVESRAMQVVEQYLRKTYKGFVINDTHATKCYDFDCVSPNQTVYVEVKGTQTLGQVISLTRNEVNFARAEPSNMLLCVVHSIQVRGRRKPKASGGTLVVTNPWDPDQHDLRPIAYVCKLRGRPG